MVNRIVLVGRLAAKPEIGEKDPPRARFTLAVERPFRSAGGDRETDFIDVVAWRSSAEFAAKYLDKGRWAAVEGRLQVRDYTNPEGQKRRSVEVVADSVQSVGPRPDEGKIVPHDELDWKERAKEMTEAGIASVADIKAMLAESKGDWKAVVQKLEQELEADPFAES